MEVDKVKLLRRQNWAQEPVCLTGHASSNLDCLKEPAESGSVLSELLGGLACTLMGYF